MHLQCVVLLRTYTLALLFPTVAEYSGDLTPVYYNVVSHHNKIYYPWRKLFSSFTYYTSVFNYTRRSHYWSYYFCWKLFMFYGRSNCNLFLFFFEKERILLLFQKVDKRLEEAQLDKRFRLNLKNVYTVCIQNRRRLVFFFIFC